MQTSTAQRLLYCAFYHTTITTAAAAAAAVTFTQNGTKINIEHNKPSYTHCYYREIFYRRPCRTLKALGYNNKNKMANNVDE